MNTDGRDEMEEMNEVEEREGDMQVGEVKEVEEFKVLVPIKFIKLYLKHHLIIIILFLLSMNSMKGLGPRHQLQATVSGAKGSWGR